MVSDSLMPAIQITPADAAKIARRTGRDRLSNMTTSFNVRRCSCGGVPSSQPRPGSFVPVRRCSIRRFRVEEFARLLARLAEELTMNWINNIFGGAAPIGWAQECARAALIFFYGLALVRLAGRRVFGKWAALDIMCRSSSARISAGR